MRSAHLWGVLGSVAALGAALLDLAPTMSLSSAPWPLHLFAGAAILWAAWRVSTRWAAVAMSLMIATSVLGVAVIAESPITSLDAVTVAPPLLGALGAVCCLGIMRSARQEQVAGEPR